MRPIAQGMLTSSVTSATRASVCTGLEVTQEPLVVAGMVFRGDSFARVCFTRPLALHGADQTV
eukprot:1556808-Alexandrium_andersonii.AAC.1